MRYYLKLFVSAALLYSLYSFSYRNAPEPASGIAFYHFFHIRDTTNIGKIWEEDFQMAFNSRKSLYSSYTKKIQDSIHNAKFEAAIKSGSNEIDMGLFVPSTADNIYTSEDENTVYVNKFFNDNNYVIKEDFEKINWKIEKETKTLLGYTCQKAIGICKGRAYTAWFTTDVPVSFGPWKLHGLPGLILEAYDASQRIKFTCTKITLGTTIPNSLSLNLPKEAIATTDAEYNRMEKAYKEGLSMDGYNDGAATIDKISVNNNKSTSNIKRPALNYPLELKN
ncbi:GLPGLI family protein [Pedobacter nototheniae]|uniref:GLPGLI family protein n=1 Tax=Pedobacter nototheniae TaxID=2488994 RepID=UPI00292D1E54|nr:GLPGLI family protein [Pedobacter nototheniae]